MENEKLHPVKFSEKQIRFIKHMIYAKAYEYWEEACEDILSTIGKSEGKQEANNTMRYGLLRWRQNGGRR